ncbi:unnamed protein product [Tenebrio molitor]|nr:unnamed protein product [Tenebrio molitor]
MLWLQSSRFVIKKLEKIVMGAAERKTTAKGRVIKVSPTTNE